MPRDFVPTIDAEFDHWIRNFLEQLSTQATALGFTAGEVTELQTLANTWLDLLESRRSASGSAKAATAAKRAARVPLVQLLRTYAKRLQAHPDMTDAIRSQMRLTVPDVVRTPVTAPAEAPQLLLDFGTRGRIIVRFGPNPGNGRRNGLPEGASGATLQYAEGGVPATDEGWAHLAVASASPYVHLITFAESSPRRECWRTAVRISRARASRARGRRRWWERRRREPESRNRSSRSARSAPRRRRTIRSTWRRRRGSCAIGGWRSQQRAAVAGIEWEI